MQPIRRILVANRGEIAVRIIRACRDLGLESVAVYSDIDRDALHVRFADLAYRLGPAEAARSYLDVERILEVAEASDADAVHPGYGFLAENPGFARACRDAGLTFIGPTAECMRLVGDKAAARRTAESAGVPVIPGSDEPLRDVDAVADQADRIGYPLMLKAAAGGGGKGMRRVDGPEELASAFRAATSEADSAFGDGRVYVEKAIVSPRHVEFQILADEHGNRVHLGERECSLQRRHQKVLEEAPSPIVDAERRAEMGRAALAMAEAAGYTNAGTVEFLVDSEGDFYFIEVNARLQVEHPVTEMLTGVDLVAQQIAMAQGEKLELGQEEIELRGHAIECRIYAEDPLRNFAPSPGRVDILRIPGGAGVRDDSCLFKGYEVPIHYDPLVAKLICWGPDRRAAIRRMRRALEEYKIGGIATTIPLFLRIMVDDDFVAGRFDTGYLDRLLEGADAGDSADLLAPYAGQAELGGSAWGGVENDANGEEGEEEGERKGQIEDVAGMAAALHFLLREERRAFAPESSGRASESPRKRAAREEALRQR